MSRRSRPRDLFLLVAGVLFLVVGVIVLIAPSRESGRASGALIVLFALAMLVVPLAGRQTRRPAYPPRLDRVEHDGAFVPAVVIEGQRATLRLLRIGAALFAAVGVLMALAPSSAADTDGGPGGVRVIGIFCAVTFGAATLIGLRTRRRPFRLVLLPAGVQWELRASPGFLGWDGVAGVGLTGISGSRFLGLDATRPDAIRMTPAQRRVQRINRVITRRDVSIALEPLPVDPLRLAQAIMDYAELPALREEIGTPRSLARIAGEPATAPSGLPGG